MKDFRHKVVVITGAGSGMGRAYAREFARLGAHLALNDHDARALADTVALLRDQAGLRVVEQAFDVGDRAAMFAFAAEVEHRLGKAHVVINNAGIEGAARPVWSTPAEVYERVMRVNFHGVVNGTQAFLPQLLANGEGAIVNVSSIFGFIGPPNHSDYAASKFAVRGFTEALMVELHDSPVQVHLVHPGGVATRIARSAASQAFSQKFLSTPPEAVAREVIRAIRCGRLRVVCGNQSFKTWLGARLLPLRWLNRLVWHDMAGVIDRSDYSSRTGATAPGSAS